MCTLKYSNQYFFILFYMIKLGVLCIHDFYWFQSQGCRHWFHQHHGGSRRRRRGGRGRASWRLRGSDHAGAEGKSSVHVVMLTMQRDLRGHQRNTCQRILQQLLGVEIKHHLTDQVNTLCGAIFHAPWWSLISEIIKIPKTSTITFLGFTRKHLL